MRNSGVERYCELANKKKKQLYKVSTLCLDVHNFKKEELETVRDLSDVWSQMVLKCKHYTSNTVKYSWKMATRNEWDELQYHNKENELERSVQQQAGQKAQQCEHQWRRWHNCTSTIAWRITTCTEPARIVSQSLIITLTFHGSSWVLHLSHPSPCHTREWLSLFDSTFSALHFFTFLLSIFLFPFFHLSDEQQPELYKKNMENLRHSAANESEDTYDVFNSPTGYEPKAHDFNELHNSSVPLSFKIPTADQDVDDLTLGEMLTEAYRGQVDYFVQEGVSVSQSSSSVRFDRSGQPDGEMVDRSGQPDECNSSKAQIRTLLEEQSTNHSCRL